MSLDIENWKSIEVVKSPRSLLNKEVEKKGHGMDGNHVMDLRSVNFRNEEQKNIELVIKKRIRGTQNPYGRRDPRYNEIFYQIINITKKEYEFLINEFSKELNFGNPQTYNYTWYSSYFTPPKTEKRGFTYSNMIQKEKAESLIKKIESEYPYTAEWSQNWFGGGKYAYRTMARTLIAEEIKDENKHIVKRPVDEKSIAKDRKENNIKIVSNKKIIKPGDFLFVSEYEPGKFAFQFGGMFDFYGKTIETAKRHVSGLVKYASENKNTLVRIYDGLATEVSVQNKESWMEEFRGKNKEEVAKTLDRRFKAKNFEENTVFSLMPYSINYMCKGWDLKKMHVDSFQDLVNKVNSQNSLW